MIAGALLPQMLGQLDMEEEVEGRRASLERSQLEKEREEGGGRERERLAAAQASLAAAEVRQRCVETVREVERRRGEAEDGDRETHAQVYKTSWNLDLTPETFLLIGFSVGMYCEPTVLVCVCVCVCPCTVQVEGGNVERMKELETLASRLGATYLGQQPQERDDGEGERKDAKPLLAEQSPALSGMCI